MKLDNHALLPTVGLKIQARGSINSGTKRTENILVNKKTVENMSRLLSVIIYTFDKR